LQPLSIGRVTAFFLKIPPEKESFNLGGFIKRMKNILSLIFNEQAKIKLEVSGEDLLNFSNDLINRAKNELSVEIAEARKEKYLTKEEVKEICGVCDATLWHWNRKNYLNTIKIGNKVRYPKTLRHVQQSQSNCPKSKRRRFS
jgi:hypothetical protein